MAPLDVPTRWQVPGAKRTTACVAALVSCSCTMPIMAKSASEHGRSRMGDMSAWSASHHDEAIMTSRRASTFRARHSQFLPSIHVQPHCAPWCGWRWRRVARDCRLVCGCLFYALAGGATGFAPALLCLEVRQRTSSRSWTFSSSAHSLLTSVDTAGEKNQSVAAVTYLFRIARCFGFWMEEVVEVTYVTLHVHVQ